jgi:hypothetical protein
MTPHRKANHNSHYAISPAPGRDVAICTRQLSGHSVSAMRHSANEFEACVGPQLDHRCGAANAAHRASLCRDETSRHDVHSARRDCEVEFVAESIVFHRSVASWCVSQDGVSPRCPVPVAERREPKTGPEMGPKKLSSATSQGSPCPAAPNNSSSIALVVGVRLRSAGYPGGAVRQVMPSAQWSQISSYGSGSGRAPHCAGVLQVRSTVLRCVGGASCPSSNRAHCHPLGLGEHGEQLFLETWREKNCLSSGASASKSGPTRRQRICRNAQAARSAAQTSTSPAIASPLTKPSWRCSTNYGPASGLESQAKEPKANAGSAVTTSGRPAMGSSRPVTGRSVTATSERMDATGGESAATSFDSANSFSVIGSARGTSAMLHPGVVDGSTTLALQAGTVVTAGETAPILSLSLPEAGSAGAVRWFKGDVREDSCSGAHPVMRGSHGFESHTTSFSSSGDGLGIHQPGSMTRGFAVERQPASGRARDRAMCPAVARFNSHGRV